MPNPIAKIDVTVNSFEYEKTPDNPKVFCEATFVKNAASTDGGRVQIFPWSIGPLQFYIISFFAGAGPVDLEFNILDPAGAQNKYIPTRVKFEQKPQGGKKTDADGTNNFKNPKPNGNKIKITNHYQHHSPTGVYWECFIHIYRAADTLTGVIDPGIENAE